MGRKALRYSGKPSLDFKSNLNKKLGKVCISQGSPLLPHAKGVPPINILLPQGSENKQIEGWFYRIFSPNYLGHKSQLSPSRTGCKLPTVPLLEKLTGDLT